MMFQAISYGIRGDLLNFYVTPHENSADFYTKDHKLFNNE